jgi:hypothetical protein
MGSNRTAGVALVAIGIAWIAAWPAFLWWMVSMEGRGGPDRPNEAAWRLWRALEILLVEPKWLAYTLSVLMLCAPAFGIALLAVGIATLGGKPPAPKWAAVTTVSGIGFCLIGLVFHWALLMPAVKASENLEVTRASEDLNLAIPVALGAGFVSMIVAGLFLLGGRRQVAPAGNLPPQT